MAEPATVARPYAEAVFELASQTHALDQWSAALARLAQAAVDPAVTPLIGNPRITDAQLVDLFMGIGGEEIGGVRKFLAALAENGRLAALPQLREQFEELKNASEGVVEAEIATAFPLSQADLDGLVAGLERRFKRKVNTSVRVDESLIGGVRIRVGDEVIDSSVRGRLAAMRSALTAP
jgi:F-type H+-transporting ATPase subunit delta